MAAEVERFGPFVCGAKGQSASSAAARLSSAFRGLRTHSVTAAAAGGEGASGAPRCWLASWRCTSRACASEYSRSDAAAMDATAGAAAPLPGLEAANDAFATWGAARPPAAGVPLPRRAVCGLNVHSCSLRASARRFCASIRRSRSSRHLAERSKKAFGSATRTVGSARFVRGWKVHSVSSLSRTYSCRRSARARACPDGRWSDGASPVPPAAPR